MLLLCVDMPHAFPPQESGFRLLVDHWSTLVHHWPAAGRNWYILRSVGDPPNFRGDGL